MRSHPGIPLVRPLAGLLAGLALAGPAVGAPDAPAVRAPRTPGETAVGAGSPAASSAADAGAWDFQRESADGEGLSTGEVTEIRFAVRPGRGLRVLLSQAGGDGDSPPRNDLDLEVEGPDGLFEGHALPGEAEPGAGALPLEHVELRPDEVSEGVWTVRVLGEWVPLAPQGYRLSVAGDVREIVPPGEEPGLAELAQNDPNPVREGTTIRFTLAGRNDILLGVYDIAGRPVRTLATGSLSAGPHAVVWDGRDATGDRVAPGIYFYRLEGGGVDVTRKLVVIR